MLTAQRAVLAGCPAICATRFAILMQSATQGQQTFGRLFAGGVVSIRTSYETPSITYQKYGDTAGADEDDSTAASITAAQAASGVSSR